MGISLLSNPPYNMPHELPAMASFMERYMGWTLPPASNANYAFILSALNQIDDRAVLLLPNGVLTSGKKEERALREEIIKQNYLLAVILLPSSMFESTSIPTCILVFDKHKETRQIALMNLQDVCNKEIRDQRGQFGGNSHTGRTYHKEVAVIPDEVARHVVELLNDRKDEDGICKWVMPEAIADNDYNLTPTRYYDIKVEYKHRSFEDIVADYNRIIEQKNAIKVKFNRTASKRLGYDCMDKVKVDLSESFAVVGQKVLKEDFVTFTNSDGIEIKISTKDGVHPLILDFLNHWKQMVIYLNTEENRVLAEFRDALLPELMNGTISLNREEQEHEDK